MIPGKDTKETTKRQSNEKIGTFEFFNPEFFIRKLIKNWYWFVILGFIGYSSFYIYNKYYVKRIYSSDISISISNNTSSYFTPNQSINFFWGQTNNDGLYLKKLILSRSHNEFLSRKLNLFINYSTKGKIKTTEIDKTESPFILEIDKNHLQATHTPITIIAKGNNRFEIIQPEKVSSNLYNYITENYQSIKGFSRPQNKIISLNQWYESPNFKFRLVKNTDTNLQNFDNVIVDLTDINETVNRLISNIDITFDKELSSIMIISKRGYNLNSTINFLNNSIQELIKKRIEDNNIVDKNTLSFIDKNTALSKQKLDSATQALNDIRLNNNIGDLKDYDFNGVLEKIQNLEKQKAELITKIQALNEINSSMNKNMDHLISGNIAGIEGSDFSTGISNLKQLYLKKRELASIYTPNSEPIIEINRLINEAKTNSRKNLSVYSNNYTKELNKINSEINKYSTGLDKLPEKERLFADAERQVTFAESTYNTLISKKYDTEMRLITNDSNITVLDEAKNLGQGPIGPNTSALKLLLIGGLLSIPLLIILISTLLDNKVRNVREIVNALKMPLLGIIGQNNHNNNLTVLEQPKSSISEAFRGVRANLRFLYDNEKPGGKVILSTSSISGEGKTYCSINIASVLALSGKKTILLGMDLRKPKIFGDFKINNKYGISNYLTGEIGIEQIINETQIPHLHVATSGPIPPNPSELLMSDRNTQFIEHLKTLYDFIIIDSPPVGLVADSYELMKHSDANIYVVRHEYTEKYMLKMIMEKYQSGEVKHLGLIYNGYINKQEIGRAHV